jgi:16S rRNA processing protein RimM
LPEGRYYHFQLIGLEVRTTGDESIGRITEVLSMASADIYVVNGKDGEILIPATDEVIKSVEPDKGYVIIEPLKGLLDLNRKKSG